MSGEHERSNAVIATLLYFHSRNIPLTMLELMRLLPADLGSSPIEELERITQRLIAQQQITASHGVLAIDGDVDFVHRRRLYCASLSKWHIASRSIARIRWIPFLRMVSITNTVAMNTAEEESDIDLLIVGRSGRLWTTRWIITVALQLMGVRRHGQQITNRLCLSFYCSDRALGLRRFCVGEHDLHYAYWVGMTATIFETEGSGVSKRFEQENYWIQEYFPQHHWLGLTPVFAVQDSTIPRVVRTIGEWVLGGWMGDRVEDAMRWVQRRMIYAHPQSRVHQGGVDVVVEDDVLKFHESDSRAEHRKWWVEQCRLHGVDPENFQLPSSNFQKKS